MGIAAEDIERVRSATDLVAVVSDQVALRRSGSRWVGLCPFHTERTPSFSVNAELGFYFCLAGETGVLTWHGVRPIRELEGTTQRVLTEKGRWVDAPFRSFGVQALRRVTLGRNGQSKTIHATPEHRWFVRESRGRRYERTTDQLRPGAALCWSFPQNRLRHIAELSPFGIAHGITYGDGSRFGNMACVDLHGEKDEQLLKWFPLNRTYACRQSDGTPYVKVLDLPLHFKLRPSLDEAPSYLAGWVAGYLAADGHVAKDGTCSLNSASRRNLEFVREVCSRLGIGTYGITSQLRRGLGNSPSPLYRVHFITEDLDERFFLIDEHRFRFLGCQKAWTRRGWVVKSIEDTERVEEVYCAMVDGTHSFVLEDNILTGNCFGCQAKGDAITFVRETRQLDFVGAVESLAGRAGIELHWDTHRESGERQRRARLVEAMARAVRWYHERLLSSPDAADARHYLRSRGYDGDVVRRFQLGWAPDGWDELCRALSLPADVARDTGLGFVNKRNRLQDSFRCRVLFPIFDARGDAVAFGGRVLPGTEGHPRLRRTAQPWPERPAGAPPDHRRLSAEAGRSGKRSSGLGGGAAEPWESVPVRTRPKYKNSAASPLYDKGEVLYGLNWAKTKVVEHGEVVVCEGYTDVIGLAAAGLPQAVATCGTSLTERHVATLRRFASRIVLAFDADGAGQAAAERVYGWERRYEVDVFVAALPPGADPADLARSDPDGLRHVVAEAKPFLAFRLDRLLDGALLASVEERARIAVAAGKVITEHPNEIVREDYASRVAVRLEVRPEHLLRGQGGDRRPASARSVPTQRRRTETASLLALGLAVHQPEAVSELLHEVLFTDPVELGAYRALARSATFQEAVAETAPEVAELLLRLAVEEVADTDAGAVVGRLVDEATSRALTEMEVGFRTGTWSGEDPQIIGWLKLRVEELRDDATRAGAVEQLLPFLVARDQPQEIGEPQ